MDFEKIVTFPGWRATEECDVHRNRAQGAAVRFLNGDTKQVGLFLDICNNHGNQYDPDRHTVTYKMSTFTPTHRVYREHLGKQLWLVLREKDGLRRTRCVVTDMDDDTFTMKLVLLKPNAWSIS